MLRHRAQLENSAAHVLPTPLAPSSRERCRSFVSSLACHHRTVRTALQGGKGAASRAHFCGLMQDELIAAVAPYVAKAGTRAAFFSDEDGRGIQEPLVGYVADFVDPRRARASYRMSRSESPSGKSLTG